MSRHGYVDDIDDNLAMGRWRARVMSATRGKRGQKLLRDTLAALDAMPVKRLIAEELEQEGEFCTLGACAKYRGIDVANIDPEDPAAVAQLFDIAEPLAREIVYMNDDWGDESPEKRWQRMRNWVAKQIIPETTTAD